MTAGGTSSTMRDKRLKWLLGGGFVGVLLVAAAILVPASLPSHTHGEPPISKTAEVFVHALHEALVEMERTQGNLPHDAPSLRMFLSEIHAIQPLLPNLADVIDTTPGEVLIKWRESNGEAMDIAYLHDFDAISCLSLRRPSE